MAEHSRLFNFLKMQYDLGKIDESYLQGQVARGRITESEYAEITGQDYPS